jgi:hypothetical protein
MAERRGGEEGGRGGWEVGEWRRAETSVWDANNTRRLGAQQGDDGDDDNNNSTMTTTTRSWARGRAEWWEGGDGRYVLRRTLVR